MNVVEIIDALAEKFGVAIDWTNQNVMPYVQELMSRVITYEIQTSMFWIIFVSTITIVLAVITPILLHKAMHQKLHYYDDWSDTGLGIVGIICTSGLVCMLITTFVVVPIQILDIIECNTIPEKVFIDIISHYAH